jgi:arylsulfatase
VKIDRRDFLKWSLALGAGISLADPRELFAAEAAARTSQPNIIFIIADDLGYGDLSCHGHPVVKTPNIDALRAASVSLTDYQASPICSPSRCALLTGRHEYRSGVSHTRGPCQQMSLDAVTLPQVLKPAGYTTGLFGKWHLGLDREHWPDKRGFDEMFTFLTGMIAEYTTANASCINPIIMHNGVDVKTSGYYTDVFFNQAMTWIDAVKGKQPFFAQIATAAVHAPVRMPPGYESRYAGKVPDDKLDTYFAMIANLDDNVGRLLAKLKDSGLENDTIVIFSSDHGAACEAKDFQKGFQPSEFYNAGMTGGKGSVREGGTRVAKFWRWPGVFPGGVEVDQLTSNIDFFPTIAELTGAAVPAGVKLDGRSLVPLLQDAKAPWPDRFVFLHHSNYDGKAVGQKRLGFAVRNNQFRLVNGKSLYDIKADRGEKNDVIANHPEVVAQMEAAYDQWWSEVLPALQAAEGQPNPVIPPRPRA